MSIANAGARDDHRKDRRGSDDHPTLPRAAPDSPLTAPIPDRVKRVSRTAEAGSFETPTCESLLDFPDRPDERDLTRTTHSRTKSACGDASGGMLSQRAADRYSDGSARWWRNRSPFEPIRSLLIAALDDEQQLTADVDELLHS